MTGERFSDSIVPFIDRRDTFTGLGVGAVPQDRFSTRQIRSIYSWDEAL